MNAQQNAISPVIGINNLPLKLRVMRLAELEKRKTAQMAKILLLEAVELKEQSLELGPIKDWNPSTATVN